MSRLTIQNDDDKAPADTYYPKAQVAIEIGDDGEVVGVSILPSEGDPGYFGPKLDERVWAAVQRYFDEIAIGEGPDALIPLRWEG